LSERGRCHWGIVRGGPARPRMKRSEDYGLQGDAVGHRRGGPSGH
jgi:hypothetical protein